MTEEIRRPGGAEARQCPSTGIDASGASSSGGETLVRPPVSGASSSGDETPAQAFTGDGVAVVADGGREGKPATRPLAGEAQTDSAPRLAPVRLAVFDYDGTIIDGQSGSLFSRYLLARRLISIRTGNRLLWWGARYKLHLPYRQDEARELIFRDLGAHSREEALGIMRRFHDEVLVPLCRADAREEIRRRHDEGCVTLLVSATFQEIAREAAEDLGFDGYAATRMELDANGRFTGRVDGEVVAGEGKCRAVKAWADARYGEGGWVVEYAYGDHFSDAPLLRLARHCFAVDPGKTLRSQAKRNGWPVLNWK